MPRKLLKTIDPESFRKSKIQYRNLNRKDKDPAPILINLEEYEAIRLYHYKKLPQLKCAKRINASQPTFSRILRSGIEKIAQALVEDKDFEIIGGHVSYEDWFGWGCWACDFEWESMEEEKMCPKCNSDQVYKLKKIVTHFK